jgi:hypothetical protein
MLVKARRKTAESRFFMYALSQVRDADAAEFIFNALLNSGKSVVNAVHAQVLSLELARSGGDEGRAKAKAKATVRLFVKAWKRTVSPASTVLFSALQEARNVEVHALGSAAQQVAQVEERIRPHPVPPLGASARAAVVGMLATGALSAEISVFETTFEVKLDPTVSTKPGVQALFKQFSRDERRPTTKTAEEYVELLDSFVRYCESRLRP